MADLVENLTSHRFLAILEPKTATGNKGYLLVTWPQEAAAYISRLREENARLQHLREFVERWAWREDPPNASHKLTDGERLSAIKFYPGLRALKVEEPNG